MTHLQTSPMTFDRLIAAAPLTAQEVSARAVTRDFSRGCENPFYAELSALPDEHWFTEYHDYSYHSLYTGEVTEGTRGYLKRIFLTKAIVVISAAFMCRKCAPCLRFKSYLWKMRAEREFAHASRTWLVTLTLRPEFHLMPVKFISKCLTLWLKKVRKALPPRSLRYMAVVEYHASGVPHVHLLCHERSVSIPKRLLQSKWSLGFTHCKLVTSDAAAYVSKYVSKSPEARVRGSIGYGASDNTSSDIVLRTEPIEVYDEIPFP